ncbi:MAG: hypothetical protein ACOC3G_08120, partial [Phycisphaeraceae bacterium]
MNPTFPRPSRRAPRSPQPCDQQRRPTRTPNALRFTPYAWSKLHRFCHAGETEVGGFGLTAPDHLLRITDVLVPKQTCSSVSVAFDDTSVADMLDEQVDRGHRPEQVLRIWCHTHPGDSPHPSPTDEATFERCFGGCEWAVMFILARGGETYARLRFGVGPGGEIELPVTVDYDETFRGSDFEAWDREYEARVVAEAETPSVSRTAMRRATGVLEPGGFAVCEDFDECDFDMRNEAELALLSDGFDPLDEPWASLMARSRGDDADQQQVDRDQPPSAASRSWRPVGGSSRAVPTHASLPAASGGRDDSPGARGARSGGRRQAAGSATDGPGAREAMV